VCSSRNEEPKSNSTARRSSSSFAGLHPLNSVFRMNFCVGVCAFPSTGSALLMAPARLHLCVHTLIMEPPSYHSVQILSIALDTCTQVKCHNIKCRIRPLSAASFSAESDLHTCTCSAFYHPSAQYTLIFLTLGHRRKDRLSFPRIRVSAACSSRWAASCALSGQKR